MAAHEGSERYFRETADRITDGAEDELVARLTSEALDMVERAVASPDRYQVLGRLAPQALMGVLAEHRPRMEAAVADAVLEALRREDAALQAVLAAQKTGAAASTTDYAQIYAAQAAKGVTEILQRQNVALADNLAKLWYKVTGDAVTRAILGDSKRDIMEDAVRALSDGGLETVDYRSRRRTDIDAATRRHIVTQANQARNRLLTQRCSYYGCELVMTSAHYGARPDHAVWQGKAYGLHGPVTVDGVRYPGLAASTGYGTVTGLAGANCRHTMTPYVPGLSKLPSTDFSAEERLHGMTSDEYYGATQVQRRLEREVRRCKRRIALGQERGLDMAADRAALGRAQGRVRQWCRSKGLPRQSERERAYGVAGQPRALGSRSVSFRESGLERRVRLEANEKKRLTDPEHATDDKRRPENHGLEYQRDCAVDFDKVGSKSYLKALRGAVIGTSGDMRLGSMADEIYEDIKRTLRAADKTPYEQLRYYDLTAERRITSVTGQRTRFGVTAGAAQQKKVREALSEGHAVASLHNHPKGSPPSAEDIRSAVKSGQTTGFICGHDGSIYQYTVAHRPIAGYSLSDKSWEDALMEIISNPAAATESVLMKWGVIVDRLF